MELFDSCDLDHNRMIGGDELCEVMRKMELSLKDSTITVLLNRFTNKQGFVHLDDFIQLCCKIKSAKEKYEKLGPDVTLGRFMFDILYS